MSYILYLKKIKVAFCEVHVPLLPAKVLNKDLTQSLNPQIICKVGLSATTTPSLSSICVELTELEPFLCLLCLVNCGSHLESVSYYAVVDLHAVITLL